MFGVSCKCTGIPPRAEWCGVGIMCGRQEKTVAINQLPWGHQGIGGKCGGTFSRAVEYGAEQSLQGKAWSKQSRSARAEQTEGKSSTINNACSF